MPSILLIDDERPNRRVLREIFEYEKFVVDEAEDGEIGLSKILSNDYDIIILDINMPLINGIEVLNELRAAGKETPVVLLSDSESIEIAKMSVPKIAFDYISKPPDLNKLLITVQNALAKSLKV
jgi:two-component system nitrogen regulation response regulator NtrX